MGYGQKYGYTFQSKIQILHKWWSCISGLTWPVMSVASSWHEEGDACHVMNCCYKEGIFYTLTPNNLPPEPIS